MLSFLKSKLKNMVKYAVLRSIEDTGPMIRITSTAMGKTSRAGLLTPYGLVGVPTEGSLAVLINLQGNESNQVGVAFDTAKRIKGFPAGTTGVENYLTGDHIICRADGWILLNSASGAYIRISPTGNVSILSANGIEIESNSTVEITAPGGVIIDGTLSGTPGVDLITHVHADPQGGTTGPPQSA